MILIIPCEMFWNIQLNVIKLIVLIGRSRVRVDGHVDEL